VLGTLHPAAIFVQSNSAVCIDSADEGGAHGLPRLFQKDDCPHHYSDTFLDRSFCQSGSAAPKVGVIIVDSAPKSPLGRISRLCILFFRMNEVEEVTNDT
jgi:hypothetical protein